MSEYYGVSTPTSDFIAHYGIRGMKWGIRKAIDRTGSGRPHSKAFNEAQRKLQRVASIGGAIGGVAGGLTKGFVGGAVGGAAGALAAGAASAIKNRKALQQNAPTKNNRIVKTKNNKKPSLKDKNFINGMQKSANKHGAIGALTVGGGALGGAIGAAKYIKQHPKEYEAFKKRYKQMSFKDRMKTSYGLS